MTRLRKRLISAAVLALLVTTGTLVISREAGAQPSGQAKGQGAAPVTIVGPLPVPVISSEVRKPFQVRLCINASSTGCGTVPGSYQTGSEALVVEQVSGGCFVGAGVDGLVLNLGSTAGGTSESHRLHLLASFGFGPEVSQQTTIYADPYSTLSLGFTTSGSGTVGCNLVLSGHTGAP
jgi:hypothetical protein